MTLDNATRDGMTTHSNITAGVRVATQPTRARRGRTQPC